MIKFTLALDGESVYIKPSEILAVYGGTGSGTYGTYIQVGMQVHFVKEDVEEVMRYLD